MGWGLPTGRVRNIVAGRGKSQELTVRADPAAVAPGGPTPAYENGTVVHPPRLLVLPLLLPTVARYLVTYD